MRAADGDRHIPTYIALFVRIETIFADYRTSYDPERVVVTRGSRLGESQATIITVNAYAACYHSPTSRSRL